MDDLEKGESILQRSKFMQEECSTVNLPSTLSDHVS